MDQIITNYSQIKKNMALQTSRKLTAKVARKEQTKTLRKQRITMKY